MGGSKFVRRRELTGKEPEIYYWDYTMGLPEDNGWTKYQNKESIAVTLESNGMRVRATENGSVVSWYPPVRTCKSGYAEFVCIPISFANQGATTSDRGIRFQVSDGTGGFRIRFSKTSQNYIQHRYWTGSTVNASGKVYDAKTFGYNVENYCKIGNNINGDSFVTIPKQNATNYMTQLVTKDITGHDISTYYTTQNLFGFTDACEVIFVSAKFVILEE